MALHEFFTYRGIAKLVDEINRKVKLSAKPAGVGKTQLLYRHGGLVARVGRLYVNYRRPPGDIYKIGILHYSDDWNDLLAPLALGVEYLNHEPYMPKSTPIKELREREFAFQFANMGVAEFIKECNRLAFNSGDNTPKKIGGNEIIYKGNPLRVVNLGGLPITYDGQCDLKHRYPIPYEVGNILHRGEILVSMGVVAPDDLK